MYFKPRIFISSTLKENLTIREAIEEHFRICGAEPLLYEVNLTPSTNQYTYRTDILEADFVIFIIKDEYGTETESGMSGTHEELKIAFDGNIPNHVYIKYDTVQQPSDRFRDIINDNHISYYYFKDDAELLKKIKETSFTIAKEATLRSIRHKTLDKNTTAIIAMNYDYEKALGAINIIEAILQYSSRFSLIETSLFMELEDLFTWVDETDWVFIDKKIQDKIEALSKVWNSYADKHGDDYCTHRSMGNINIPIWGEHEIYSYVKCQKYSGYDYQDCIEKFIKIFVDFKEYIKDRKLYIDKLNF